MALERNDRTMWRRFKAASLAGISVIAHGGVVGQAWRGKGPRQALLARALVGMDIRPLDDVLGRVAGELLATAGGTDVIDAALVLLADDGDQILTSDPDDIESLAAAAGRHIELIHV